MAYVCGAADTSCPYYNKGMCEGHCEYKCITGDSMFGDIDSAQIRYMAKILENQKNILERIAKIEQAKIKQ